MFSSATLSTHVQQPILCGATSLPPSLPTSQLTHWDFPWYSVWNSLEFPGSRTDILVGLKYKSYFLSSVLRGSYELVGRFCLFYKVLNRTEVTNIFWCCNMTSIYVHTYKISLGFTFHRLPQQQRHANLSLFKMQWLQPDLPTAVE